MSQEEARNRIIEIYPESFHQLRRVLMNEHQDIWQRVGWAMIHDQQYFVSAMNEELSGIVIPAEFTSVADCCERWLKAIEKRPKYRKVSELDMNLAKGKVV